MLSIQSPGYVGMERFGVDISLDSLPNQRTSRECDLQSDSTKSHDLLRSSDSSLLSRKMVINKNSLNKDKSDHNQHYCHHAHDGSIHCPHHVPLPDCEWNSANNHNNNNLRIRNAYQQAEITRSYIKPPPNKTVLDVPITSFNIIPEASTMHLNNERHGTIQTSVKQFKYNPITKFLLRISSPKTHENHNGNENVSYNNNNNHHHNHNNNNNNNHHHQHHQQHHSLHSSNNSSCTDMLTATAPSSLTTATTASTTATSLTLGTTAVAPSS